MSVVFANGMLARAAALTATGIGAATTGYSGLQGPGTQTWLSPILACAKSFAVSNAEVFLAFGILFMLWFGRRA